MTKYVCTTAQICGISPTCSCDIETNQHVHICVPSFVALVLFRVSFYIVSNCCLGILFAYLALLNIRILKLLCRPLNRHLPTPRTTFMQPSVNITVMAETFFGNWVTRYSSQSCHFLATFLRFKKNVYNIMSYHYRYKDLAFEAPQ